MRTEFIVPGIRFRDPDQKHVSASVTGKAFSQVWLPLF